MTADFGADRALAEAWGDYLDRHRDEIAENFERAAELIRAGDTHGLAEHVGRNRRARAEAAASDSHAASTHPDTLAQDLREIAEEIVDPRTEEGRTLLIAAEKLDRYRAALEQICSTPSRNWHLNARIAREAMR